jgi:hypothetical protein
VRARGREKRFLGLERAFEQAVALRSEPAVAGKFRRRYRRLDVVKLRPGYKRAIKGNADHNGIKGFGPICKGNPPAGKETPSRIIIRSSLNVVPRVFLSAGPISIRARIVNPVHVSVVYATKS